MRRRGIAAIVAGAAVVAGCGLELDGLEAPPDAAARDAGYDGAGDGTVMVGDDDDATPLPEASGDDADTGTVADATADTSTMDAPDAPSGDGACPGVTCNGVCLVAPDCTTCPGASLLCPGASVCVPDCTMCTGSPIECFACNMDRLNPIGTCQPPTGTTYCLDTNYAGAYDGQQGYHCGCVTAADCPGNDQVCISVSGTPTTACYACGEVDTDMATCNGPGPGTKKCNQAMAMCK